MDQEAFRKLLSAGPSSARTGASTSRGSILPIRAKATDSNNVQSKKPELKPRKVKKGTGDAYRDRAAERRQGVAGDFAQVEAVLENFEKQHADDEDKHAVEEQRRYLGGDADHTVLVKGLDFALLEQNRVREAITNVEDDESLEDAFRSGATAGSDNQPSTARKKRTREDLLRELKEKRGKGSKGGGSGGHTEVKTDVIKRIDAGGKFKPIGFKPIGGAAAAKGREGKGDGLRKKKKRRVAGELSAQSANPPSAIPTPTDTDKTSTPRTTTTVALPEPPQPEDDDFDIFADAGDYKGLEIDDEDEDKEEGEVDVDAEPQKKQHSDEDETTSNARKWFDDEEDVTNERKRLPVSLRSLMKGKEKDDGEPPRHSSDEEQSQQEEKPVIRLAPLASSTIPSIRDILAADEALDAEVKRKARKEKRKAGGGGRGGAGGNEDGEGKKKASAEAKANRDYQQVMAYTSKKEKS